MRILRAPFFLAAVAFSFIPAMFIFATITVGEWFDTLLRRVGLAHRKEWVPLVGGIVGYTVLGIVLPAYLGKLVMGLAGAILLPLVALVVIAIVDRW